MDRAAAGFERVRAAEELFATQLPSLRRTARRFSLCLDDAEDAVQRAAVILLTKAPPIEGRRLIGWMTVVTRREALALRRGRERLLVARPASADGDPAPDPIDTLAADAPGPAERTERRERAAAARRALAALKPDQRVALVLQAEGYSYAEICALRGWTYTKVNRCLAEGRAALRAGRSGSGRAPAGPGAA